MTKPCERCGANGERITTGKFAGDHLGVGYCAFCSADLCRTCITSGWCSDSADHVHREEIDCERCAGVGRLHDSKCIVCDGSGMVLR